MIILVTGAAGFIGAYVGRAHAAFGFEPRMAIDEGMPKVVARCRDYFGDKL